jgi:hypothetical protein
MFISLSFLELNESLKKHILKSMLISFDKFFIPNILNNDINIEIYNRFTKKSCIVDLYYDDNKLQGVCISWSCNKYIYLDKFFSLKLKNGIGKSMLDLFIQKYNNNNTNNKLLWRTDTSTSLFYKKNNKIITHFENKEYDIVYMGVNNIIWEYEDIYNIKLKSCFYL